MSKYTPWYETEYICIDTIIASIMTVKIKYYNEKFVTIEEINLIKTFLEHISYYDDNLRFQLKAFEINKIDFYVVADFVLLTEYMVTNLSRLDTIYKANFKKSKYFEFLWNEDLIYALIHELYKIKLELDINKNQNYPRTSIDLDEILDRLFVSSTSFYERIADGLTPEELNQIISSLPYKNCSNCTNQNCNISPKNGCHHWQNNELIGKTKILKKAKVKFWQID